MVLSLIEGKRCRNLGEIEKLQDKARGLERFKKKAQRENFSCGTKTTWQ
jgi:hypothetical protein